jgi:hypothetical protein
LLGRVCPKVKIATISREKSKIVFFIILTFLIVTNVHFYLLVANLKYIFDFTNSRKI